MTASFGDQFVSAFTGKPAKPRPERQDRDRAARVDASTRLGRWCWRWRLHLAVVAPPALWGAARFAVAAPGTWTAVRALTVRQWQGLLHQAADTRWPSPTVAAPAAGWWGPAVWALLACTVAVAAGQVLARVPTGRWGRLLRREAQWRTCRLLEHRWEEAMLANGWSVRRFGRTRTPRLERVNATGWGGSEGRVWFPKGFEMGKLAGGDTRVDQLLRRELELPGRGTCEQLVWSLPDEDEATYRVVEVVHRNMPRPDQLPLDDRPADDDNTLRIGATARGFHGWDLNAQPFLRCSGRSGSGKGHWSRWIISQAVQKGWLVVIIDGAGAPEHKPWAALPNVRYAKLRVNAPDEALAQFAGQVAEVQNLAATRQALCDALDLDDWKSMDDELRREHPRILVVFDEFTALMGRAPEDDSTKQLRQHLGWMINRMLRLYRKYGVNAIIVDQITYAGTWIGPDGLAQAAQFVWCGMPNRVQQNMLSSGAKFPTVPNRPGYGLVGVAGELEATPIVWARFDRADVKRIVADELDGWGLVA